MKEISKTNQETDITKSFWDVVHPGYQSTYTIDDFTGLRPISTDKLVSKLSDSENVEEICNYMVSHNYYLSGSYKVRLFALDDIVEEKKHVAKRVTMVFDGNFTASDIYKIHNSLYITNASVIHSTLKSRNLFPTMKMESVAKEYAEAMVNDREHFMPMFKDCIKKHPEFCYSKSYEELANEYIDFVAPHVYNNFKCPISYNYYDVYGTWEDIKESKAA